MFTILRQTIIKLNAAVDLDVQAFNGSTITDYNTGLTNVIIGTNAKATQRPSINITEDCTTIVGLLARARGIYYWEANSKLYIVNDNNVYESSQRNPRIPEISGNFSSGTEPCTILETVGIDRLVILDAENNKGWQMDKALNLNPILINFPITLAHGGVILDGYLFVMDEDGVIYNSAVNDPTTFPATGFITAERENDKGVYLAKHHDHVVAFGTRTIEFLYDASNTTGSPLNRRQDISYTYGCASGLSVWEDNDIIYFLGTDSSGQLGVWKLDNFQISPVSTDAINSYLSKGLTQSGLIIRFEGLSAMGHRTLLVTIYTLTGVAPGEISPKSTLSFDSLTGLWGFWKTDLSSNTTFPLISWTKRTGGQNETTAARTGEGLMFNGDIIELNDDFIPIDTVLGSSIYEEGIYETDIYSVSSDIGVNISSVIRFGLTDGGVSVYKFQNKESIVMESTSSPQTLTVKHSDELTSNFNGGQPIDTALDRKEIYQGGRFMKRNYQIEYSGNEQFFIEAIDVELSAGL